MTTIYISQGDQFADQYQKLIDLVTEAMSIAEDLKVKQTPDNIMNGTVELNFIYDVLDQLSADMMKISIEEAE